MKNIMRRLLVVMLALMLAGSVMLPAAMATEVTVMRNATNSMTLYVGMRDQLVVTDTSGNPMSASQFRWKSNKSAVVSVNSSGAITAKKAGSATITATNKSNSRNKVTMKVTVKRNKASSIYTKPSASAAPYQNWIIRLKSVEIVSPTQVVAEYYVAFNFPSSWRATKFNYVNDALGAYYRSTGALYQAIARGNSKKISGFKARGGAFVQTIKVTYSGGMVEFTNLRLKDFLLANSPNVQGSVKVKR